MSKKLTEIEVTEIKDHLAMGEMTREEIAEEYGVEVTAIKRISSGRTWSHVPGPEPKKRANEATDEEVVDELVRRKAAGEHVKEIAADLGIDWSTAYRLLRKRRRAETQSQA